jgi:hypothetical protein
MIPAQRVLNQSEKILENSESPAPAGPVAAAADARASHRSGYSAIQRVAFHEESQAPTPSMFVAVRCRDISTQGIAFFVSDRPITRFCTVALTRGEKVIYVRCGVVRTCPPDDDYGKWMVGCQFLGRSDHL